MRFYKVGELFYPSATTVIHHETRVSDRIRRAKRNQPSNQNPRPLIEHAANRGTLIHAFLEHWIALNPFEQMDRTGQTNSIIELLKMTAPEEWEGQDEAEIKRYCNMAVDAYIRYPEPISSEFHCGWSFSENQHLGIPSEVVYSDDDTTLPFSPELLGDGIVGRCDLLLPDRGEVNLDDLKTSQGYYSQKGKKWVHRVYLFTKKGKPNARHKKLTEQLALYNLGMPPELPKPTKFSVHFVFPSRFDTFEFSTQEIEEATERAKGKLQRFRTDFMKEAA